MNIKGPIPRVYPLKGDMHPLKPIDYAWIVPLVTGLVFTGLAVTVSVVRLVVRMWQLAGTDLVGICGALSVSLIAAGIFLCICLELLARVRRGKDD